MFGIRHTRHDRHQCWLSNIQWSIVHQSKMNTIFPFSEIKINAICVTLAQTRKYLMHASEMNGWFLTDPVSRIVYQKPSISMDACAPNAHLCMIVYFYYIHLNYANLCKYINHISGRATRALVENNKKKKNR